MDGRWSFALFSSLPPLSNLFLNPFPKKRVACRNNQNGQYQTVRGEKRALNHTNTVSLCVVVMSVLLVFSLSHWFVAFFGFEFLTLARDWGRASESHIHQQQKVGRRRTIDRKRREGV